MKWPQKSESWSEIEGDGFERKSCLQLNMSETLSQGRAGFTRRGKSTSLRGVGIGYALYRVYFVGYAFGHLLSGASIPREKIEFTVRHGRLIFIV